MIKKLCLTIGKCHLTGSVDSHVNVRFSVGKYETSESDGVIVGLIPSRAVSLQDSNKYLFINFILLFICKIIMYTNRSKMNRFEVFISIGLSYILTDQQIVNNHL